MNIFIFIYSVFALSQQKILPPQIGVPIATKHLSMLSQHFDLGFQRWLNQHLNAIMAHRVVEPRKNKFTFSSVEAPVWQGAKAKAYQDISSFRNAARRDASALENVKLFLREPLGSPR
ncbi:MAG: hypothetical protein PVJ19_14900, partial [Desulfobacteraceae bacterium]